MVYSFFISANDFFKKFKADPLICLRCSTPMQILAIIRQFARLDSFGGYMLRGYPLLSSDNKNYYHSEVKKVLRDLVKIGRPPQGLDASLLN
jgi:hypothetical protein